MLLQYLIENLTNVKVNGDTNIDINKIEYNSKKITKGDIFVAISGYKDDGKLIDQPTLRNRMEGYFKQVIQYFETTYPDVIYAWDVVNEAVEQDGFGYEESLWYQIYGGVSYIADAFQIARKYSKPPVKLFYNDYNVFIPLKTQKIIEITKPIINTFISLST